MGEDFDFRVKQVLAEIERMQPDIDKEVNEKFAAQSKGLEKSEQGTMGNVQAANLGKLGPTISVETKKGLATNFQDRREELEEAKAVFRKGRTEFRIDFLVGQYSEGATAEERAAVFDAVHKTLYPSIAENEAGEKPTEGDYFNPADFETANSNEAEGSEKLTDTFNDAASHGYTPPAGGLEP